MSDEPRGTYEGAEDGLSYISAMVAGAAAGLAEHVALYPVDTIKTRMQVLLPGSAPYTTMMQTVRQIVVQEGGASLFRGVQAMVWGAGPSHAVHFAAYELAKRVYGGHEHGHRPLETAAAGATATVISDAVACPMDVVKQRLQVTRDAYTGMTDCMRKVYTREGVRAFYAGYPTTIVMNVPFMSIYFSVYESVKKVLVGSDRASDEYEGPLVICVAGGIAGMAASAVTNPLDVVKTRLQTQSEGGSRRYSSMLDCVKTIAREEGLRGFQKGMGPRMLFHAPASIIQWSTYELAKHLLSNKT